MPRDTNGNTQPLPGTIVANGDTILPSQHNPALVDLYAMMTQSLSRDGQGGMRANLDMSGFRVINVGEATLDTDAISLGQSRVNGVPIGATMDFAGSTAPETWMLCYGQAISRVTYATLFTVIGTSFGAGNGTTTFNLPDLRGRVVAGKDNMGGTDAGRLSGYYGAIARVLGGALGSAFHVLTVGQIPVHNHGGQTTGGIDVIPVTLTDLVKNLFGTFSFSGGGNAGFANVPVSMSNHYHVIPSQGGGRSASQRAAHFDYEQDY